MTIKKEKEWHKFELAVTELLTALDKNAKVTHDVSIPDKDTGKPRQRDIWVEATVCSFKMTIYVSCKNYNKKLDQQDIDAVIGELISSGANKGIIFSKLGFTEDAILKASKKDIECCSLVNSNNHKKIIPESLIIKQYAQKAHINYYLNGISNKEQVKVFLNSKYKESNRINSDIISEYFKELENESLLNNSVPLSKKLLFTCSEFENKIQITLQLDWIYYFSNLTGYYINGFYKFRDTKFEGEIIFPIINKNNPHLGPDWTSCEKPTSNNFIMITLNPSIEQYKEMLYKFIE